MQPKNFGGTFVVVLRLRFNASEQTAVQEQKHVTGHIAVWDHTGLG